MKQAFILITFLSSSLFAQSMSWKETELTGGSLWAYDLLTCGPSVFAAVGGKYHGIIRSKDNGKTWETGGFGLTLNKGDGRDLACDSNGTLYAILQNGLICSVDNGDTWTSIDPPKQWSGETYYLALQASANGIYVVSEQDSQYIFYSDTKGLLWAKLHASPQNARIDDLCVTPNGTVVYMENSAYAPGIFSSTDKGKSWARAFDDLPVRFGRMNCGPSGEMYFYGGYEFFWTTSLGAPFTQLSEGLTTQFFGVDLAVTKKNRLYVSTNGYGVYYSDNRGPWYQISKGLFHLQTFSIVECPDGSILCGTDGGAYRLEPTMEVEGETVIASASLNFVSNPCIASSTEIQYSVNTKGLLSITLYNTQGSLVKTIKHGIENPGRYREAVDLNDIPNGAYLCVLNTEASSIVKNLIVSK